jgi:hypothetical protein
MISPKNAIAFPLVMILIGLFPLVARSADGVAPTPDQFHKVRGLIKPHTGEDKWAEIPWSANLWEARERAAASGKPILLWEMDGNPLGCG